MKLFFGEIIPEIKIHDEEQQHILKVLRMKEGEEIFVTDGKGNSAKGNLIIEGKKVGLQDFEIQGKANPFAPYLHIAIAPTKNIDRIEFFVEKAVEMGVSEITFLQTEKSERRNINFERLVKQSIAASKQSLRFHFPVMNPLIKLQDFVKYANAENTFVAHCHENLKRIGLQEIKPNIKTFDSDQYDENAPTEPLSNITFLIGPEGDFSEKEIQLFADYGIRAVYLGQQRLRTETAGIFVAAWNYEKMQPQ